MHLILNAIYELDGTKNNKAKEKVNEIFLKYDVDNSGSINKNEFITAIYNEKIFEIFH